MILVPLTTDPEWRLPSGFNYFDVERLFGQFTRDEAIIQDSNLVFTRLFQLPPRAWPLLLIQMEDVFDQNSFDEREIGWWDRSWPISLDEEYWLWGEGFTLRGIDNKEGSPLQHLTVRNLKKIGHYSKRSQWRSMYPSFDEADFIPLSVITAPITHWWSVELWKRNDRGFAISHWSLINFVEKKLYDCIEKTIHSFEEIKEVRTE